MGLMLGRGVRAGRWAGMMAAVGVLGMAQAGAQATGDARTVTEPVIPASCTVLQAQQGIVSGEPQSETTLDTARVQAALNGCAAGQAVELAVSGSNNAFLTGPISIPTGVTLLVDGGVTLFGSRNPADYQSTAAGVETCGTVGTAGNGCQALITAGAANAGIMGYGVIDGRAQDKLLVNGVAQTYSWWDQAGNAQNKSGGAQNNPILVSAGAANLVLYKITFRNSPMFHVKWSGNTTTKTGFTAWGVKVITPFSTRNTDGIDPSGQNISVLYSSISDGDDNVAVSASSAAANITVANVNTYSGHGISVGSITKGGLTNMLVQNITQMGTAADRNAIGLRIKAQQSNGGPVQNVTYQNICSANNKVAIYLSPYYSTSAGTLYPSFSNIVYRNIHVLTENTVVLQGYRNTTVSPPVINTATVTLDNVVLEGLQQKDLNPAPQDVAFTLGPGPVSAPLTSQTGTNVTYSGSVTNPGAAPYPCNASNFQYLVGELYGSTASATNLQAASLTAPATVTLNAMLEPAMSQVSYTSVSSGGSYTGMPAPTAAINFLDNGMVVGTGTLGGNGTLASLTLPGVGSGTHTYTAVYPGDSTYTVPLTLGTVTVSVAGQTTATALAANPSNLTYGQSTMLTATVTGGGSPGGSVNFLDGSTVIGTATLSGGTATLSPVLGAGPHTLTAMYLGDANDAGSTSTAASVTVAPAVLTVTGGNASRVFGTVNPGLSYTISGFVNGDTAASSVTGAAALTTSATRISGAGGYQIVPSAGTLAAANYTFAFAAGTLTVMGGAAQTITFPALPNFPQGTTASLLANATSGENVSFAVTSGPATISGTTLTVTGPGMVTVTASQAGDANYAAAASVSQSFTAQ